MGVKKDLRYAAGFLADVARARGPRIAYSSGWLGYLNLGDEALFAAQRLLFPGCGLVRYPEHRLLSPLRAALGTPRNCVLAGGTLINGMRGWLDTFRHCQQWSRYSFIFGSGVQDPEFWTGQGEWTDFRADWLPALERCSYVGVRGPRSLELLQDAGFSGAEVIGDPVLACADPDLIDAARDLVTADAPVLGLNIGRTGGKLWGDEEKVCAEAAKLAGLAAAAGWRVRWFVVWPHDMEATRKAVGLAGGAGEVVPVYEDYAEYLDEVRGATVFVGMKLHATVLATCAWVPSIMLEYRPKCRDYMASIGQQDMNVRTDAADGGELWERVGEIAGRRAEHVSRLAEGMLPLIRKQRDRAQAVAADLLGDS